MRDVLALLTAGVGICFLGLELVTSGLQESTSRTLRALIRRSTKSGPWCAVLGISAGTLMQSTTAVATVVGSMAAAGMVALRQALPIVAFANVGTTILVFAGAVDFRIAVLLAVGIAGIGYSLTNEFRLRAMVSIALGIALLLYGSNLVTTAASDVEHANWFSNFLNSWYGSTAMAFALGTVASFLTQSTATVALIAVALANAGLLELDEAVTMIYGANLGSTLMRMLLTQRTTGTLRQVSRFQDLFKLTGTAVFVFLFVLEERFDVPLVRALAGATGLSLPLQLATINLLFNGSMAVLATLLARPIERLVATTWPPSAIEDLSTPKYATHDGLGDASTAIDLVEKEQMRILKRTRDYLSLVRPPAMESRRLDPDALHKSFALLFRELGHFHAALMGKHLDESTSERLGNAHGREELLELVEASLYELAMSAKMLPAGSKLSALAENFAEALDFLLMFAGDAARTLDRDRAQFVFDLSSDRGDMMGGIRSLYLAPEQALSGAERALLLRFTTLFERVVWMLQRYADLLLKNVAQAESEA
jgi:phosphate:Na+ symporter